MVDDVADVFLLYFNQSKREKNETLVQERCLWKGRTPAFKRCSTGESAMMLKLFLNEVGEQVL